jgi:hypothetical protein
MCFSRSRPVPLVLCGSSIPAYRPAQRPRTRPAGQAGPYVSLYPIDPDSDTEMGLGSFTVPHHHIPSLIHTEYLLQQI